MEKKTNFQAYDKEVQSFWKKATKLLEKELLKKASNILEKKLSSFWIRSFQVFEKEASKFMEKMLPSFWKKKSFKASVL